MYKHGSHHRSPTDYKVCWLLPELSVYGEEQHIIKNTFKMLYKWWTSVFWCSLKKNTKKFLKQNNPQNFLYFKWSRTFLVFINIAEDWEYFPCTGVWFFGWGWFFFFDISEMKYKDKIDNFRNFSENVPVWRTLTYWEQGIRLVRGWIHCSFVLHLTQTRSMKLNLLYVKRN